MNYPTKYLLAEHAEQQPRQGERNASYLWRGLTLALLLLLSVTGWGQGFGYMEQIPEEQGFVNDYVGLLSRQQKLQLESFLTQNAQQTSNEVAIAIMNLPEGASVSDFTNDAARKWGIGGSDNNNGVLIAVYPNARKMRIEVGYGLEPVITDALSDQIIREQMKPAFQRGDYYNGLVLAAKSLTEAARGEYDQRTGRTYRNRSRQGDGGGGFNLIVLVLIIVAVIALIRRGGGGGGGGYGGGGWSWFPLFWLMGSGWGGGGGHHHGGGFGGGFGGGSDGGFGGGDFGGFGGGDFGGGGAMGDW